MSFPYAMLSKMVPANSTGSCCTSPIFSRRDLRVIKSFNKCNDRALARTARTNKSLTLSSTNTDVKVFEDGDLWSGRVGKVDMSEFYFTTDGIHWLSFGVVRIYACATV
ncbi:hypothetical protein IEQ34_019139 [Dendrobium chrysotoxum]|uniref:Uncharacterized protein n=1 Tax=Dendrobium chrysotoxum TaxID=161865 RepID=A0AAV7G6X8_DENCH|nr:hypothetical protein IEQ34_019139 [Dendrobium chrysotoxum]